MAIFGSFTYGSSQVYGSDSSPLTVTFIAQNLIRVDFLAELVVDAAIYDISNYSLGFADGSGTDVNLRQVVPFSDERTTTQHVLLLTDRHTRGTAYKLIVSNLRPRVGGTLPTATSAARTNRRTKVDSILASLPTFFDRRPGSVVGSLAAAMGLEDERIGGLAVNEFDITKTLESLTQHKQETKQGNAGGLIGGIIAVVMFIVVIAIFAFQAWRSGKERAKLLHEKAVREEEARRIQVDIQLAENAETAVELLKKVDRLEGEAQDLEARAEVELARHRAAVATIQSATSWDQIDQLLDQKKPDQP